MIHTIAHKFILLFGIFVSLFCLWAIVVPQKVHALVRGVTDTTWGYLLAAGVRLLLGLALLLAAPGSRFPTTFVVLGWVTIAAAVGIVLMGRERMGRLIDWFSRLSDTAVRAWLMLGVAFGLLLAYGVW